MLAAELARRGGDDARRTWWQPHTGRMIAAVMPRRTGDDHRRAWWQRMLVVVMPRRTGDDLRRTWWQRRGSAEYWRGRCLGQRRRHGWSRRNGLKGGHRCIVQITGWR
jgi:hypothetical protein